MVDSEKSDREENNRKFGKASTGSVARNLLRVVQYRGCRAMKFVIVQDGNNVGGSAHSWRLETDSGFVLAKSTRSLESKEKCLREIADIKRDAAVTKVLQK